MRANEVDRLYRTHVDGLFGFMVAQTGDRYLAEDLVAETFIRALSARRGFDRRRGTEKSWLYAIAINLARDQHRRQGAESRAFERQAAGGPDVTAEAAGARMVELVERRDTIAHALTSLTAEERETVDLRYRADLTVPEISRATGAPVTTIDGRLYRALRKLRAQLVD